MKMRQQMMVDRVRELLPAEKASQLDGERLIEFLRDEYEEVENRGIIQGTQELVFNVEGSQLRLNKDPKSDEIVSLTTLLRTPPQCPNPRPLGPIRSTGTATGFSLLMPATRIIAYQRAGWDFQNLRAAICQSCQPPCTCREDLNPVFEAALVDSDLFGLPIITTVIVSFSAFYECV